MFVLLVFSLSLWNVVAVWGQEENRVLRHAVFFKFKESASEQDVGRALEAFESLPAKIDSIVGFMWGKRINDDAISGGFTHCFLITFKDESGRAEYLPHEDHRAFAELLRPLLEDVFVIDFWGRPGRSPSGKVLWHAVFLKFKPDADPIDIDRALQAFASLPEEIDTVQGMEWGTNNSPESLDDGFSHAFLVTFATDEGLAAYGPHPAHQALVTLLQPVLQEVRVLDFWTE